MSEQALLEDVCRLVDEGVIVAKPIVTVVGSIRNKEKADEASRFVAELYRKYPWARLVVGGVNQAKQVVPKSPVEKAAVEMAELLDMPVEVVEAGKKGEWDHGQSIQDERVVARSTHVVVFDDSAHSRNYVRLAKQQRKFSQIVE